MRIAKLVITVIIVAGLFFTIPASAEKSPIKIGFIGAMSGGSAVLGERCSEGFKMFWDEYNEKGGLHGQKIDLIIDDDEAIPAKGITAANKQITKDGIVAGFATTNSPVTYAVVPVFKKYGIPHVTQAFSPGITKAGSKYVFRVAPTIVVNSRTLYKWASKELNLKTVAIISDKGAYGKTVGDVWEKLAPEYGIKVLTRQTINLEDKDFTGQLLKIKKLNPQMVIFAVNWELTMGLIAKNMRKLGINTPILTGALDVDKFAQYGGKAVNGTIISLPLSGFEEPKDRADFARRFKAKYGKGPVVHNVWGYDAANILALAMEKVYPDLTPENICKAISSFDHLKLLQGTYDFKTSQDGISRSQIIKLDGDKRILMQ